MATSKTRKPSKRVPKSSDYEAISATVPSAIVTAVRARTAKRDFSRFVATALARELTREARTEYLEHAERDGLIGDDELRAAIEHLTS